MHSTSWSFFLTYSFLGCPPRHLAAAGARQDGRVRYPEHGQVLSASSAKRSTSPIAGLQPRPHRSTPRSSAALHHGLAFTRRVGSGQHPRPPLPDLRLAVRGAGRVLLALRWSSRGSIGQRQLEFKFPAASLL